MPRDDPGFSRGLHRSPSSSRLPMVLGLDPLKLTMFSMALTAASLPLTVVPFLFLMNDERFVKRASQRPDRQYRGPRSIIALGFVLAVVTIPLEILGG